MQQPPSSNAGAGPAGRRIGRREFLRPLVAGAGAWLLAACGAGSQRSAGPAASPAPRTSATPAASVAPALEHFLALSAMLTGFEQLDATLGGTYLAAIQDSGADAALTTLYERAGLLSGAPAGLDALEWAGVFQDPQLGRVADTIITNWYSGSYEHDGKQVVATYFDALGWKAMAYAKPRGVCGPGTDFWQAVPPGQARMPNAFSTVLPQSEERGDD